MYEVAVCSCPLQLYVRYTNGYILVMMQDGELIYCLLRIGSYGLSIDITVDF